MKKCMTSQNRFYAGTRSNQIEILNKISLINITTPESKIESTLLSPMETEPNSTTSLIKNTSAI